MGQAEAMLHFLKWGQSKDSGDTHFFPLPSILFCSVPWANWNGLNVNWMRGDECWDCDLWPTFGTCAQRRRCMVLKVVWEFVHWTWARGPVPGYVSSLFRISHFTRQTKTNSVAYYSTVVSLHGWLNPSGPAVFAQRSGWTAQEGLNASYSTWSYMAAPTSSQATESNPHLI